MPQCIRPHRRIRHWDLTLVLLLLLFCYGQSCSLVFATSTLCPRPRICSRRNRALALPTTRPFTTLLSAHPTILSSRRWSRARIHFIRECVASGSIVLRSIASVDNVADI